MVIREGGGGQSGAPAPRLLWGRYSVVVYYPIESLTTSAAALCPTITLSSDIACRCARRLDRPDEFYHVLPQYTHTYGCTHGHPHIGSATRGFGKLSNVICHSTALLGALFSI